MVKQILFILFFFILKPAFTEGQDGTNSGKANALFEECMPLFKKLLTYNLTNKDSAKIINKELIVKLEEVYSIDTTNPVVGHYLANCYQTERNFREVIKWSKNQLLNSKNVSDLSDYNYYIGCSYISLGELDSSKFYIEKAIKLRETERLMLPYEIKDLILGIKEIADSVYMITDNELAKKLKLKSINPCSYSLHILDYIQPFTEIYFDKTLLSKTKGETVLKKNNCR